MVRSSSASNTMLSNSLMISVAIVLGVHMVVVASGFALLSLERVNPVGVRSASAGDCRFEFDFSDSFSLRSSRIGI